MNVRVSDEFLRPFALAKDKRIPITHEDKAVVEACLADYRRSELLCLVRSVQPRLWKKLKMEGIDATLYLFSLQDIEDVAFFYVVMDRRPCHRGVLSSFETNYYDW